MWRAADSVEVDASSAQAVKRAAELFAVDEKKLIARLTTRNITVSKNGTHFTTLHACFALRCAALCCAVL
jgi:hypothetical protein